MLNAKKNRDPIRRQGAEVYLQLTLLSFAASVALTRLFLSLTGYPKIGSGELHIAHVLWGGLLLFAASLLPLIFANRWVYTLGALLAGAGVGLFIDEVGKFITQSNDYFYPSAAPIIYAFFLLTALLYLRIRRKRRTDARADLYYILQDLEEVLDQDLNEDEYSRIIARLENLEKKAPESELTRLARAVEKFLTSKSLYLAPDNPTPWEKLRDRWQTFEKKHLSRRRYQAFLAGGLFAWSLWAISYPLEILFSLRSPLELQGLVRGLVSSRLVRSMSGISFFEARVGLEGSVGLILLAAAILFIFKRERLAVSLGYLGLLVSLSIVNLMMFYFDQFSTIINATIQFILLLGILRYRRLYLKSQIS